MMVKRRWGLLQRTLNPLRAWPGNFEDEEEDEDGYEEEYE